MIYFLIYLLGAPENNTSLSSRPVHTYSIVAYDPQSGEVGAAVQSHWFSVGSSVIWVESGVGAVATQSFVNVDYGPWGLAGMAKGKAPEYLIKTFTAGDDGRDVRQVAMVDIQGNVAGYTGEKCIDFACDIQGKSFSVQANIMLKNTVCAAMSKAYTSSSGPLSDRLLAALQAAQAEGGDLRGKQSAAIKVVKAKRSDKPWRDVVLELRVEDHKDPIAELARLLHVRKAYDFMDQGDADLEHGKIDEAMASYKAAEGMLTGRVEPLFWHAVNLVNSNQLESALPMFAQIFKAAPDWRLMPDRLVKVGLLPDESKILHAIKVQ